MRIRDWSSVVCSVDLRSFIERAGVKAKNNVRIHLNEAARAVPGKTLVARCGSKALNRLIVKAKIKDNVHHARHGHTRARTDGYKQRVGSIAETLASDTLDMRETVPHFLLQALGIGFRSAEHTSELQPLMRNSYNVSCWKKK